METVYKTPEQVEEWQYGEIVAEAIAVLSRTCRYFSFEKLEIAVREKDDKIVFFKLRFYFVHKKSKKIAYQDLVVAPDFLNSRDTVQLVSFIEQHLYMKLNRMHKKTLGIEL